MKATGFVRRIDDLGRIVIPKEIRKTLKIKDGEPFEIFIGKNGGSCISKIFWIRTTKRYYRYNN